MPAENRILLCSDMDRTLLPNGPQPESPLARPLLRKLAERNDLELVYVTGRDKKLIEAAIQEYSLPVPRIVVGDVGSSIYEVREQGSTLRFEESEAWSRAIAGDWNNQTSSDLAEKLAGNREIRLQEPEKQNRFKLSYYGDPELDHETLVARIGDGLAGQGIKANLIWSVDEEKGVGLLDILPGSANKLQAVRFLINELGYDQKDVIFAGDSGNDLAVLTSGLQAVLVANAAEEVRKSAAKALAERGLEGCLYQARGGFRGMNGNYAAGVLEGLVHFKAVVASWIEEALARQESKL